MGIDAHKDNQKLINIAKKKKSNFPSYAFRNS